MFGEKKTQIIKRGLIKEIIQTKFVVSVFSFLQVFFFSKLIDCDSLTSFEVSQNDIIKTAASKGKFTHLLACKGPDFSLGSGNVAGTPNSSSS